MCGIAGVVSTQIENRSDARIGAMLSALRHRGPDDEGVRTIGDCGLGVRRLAVIDLQGGHQPMANSSEDVWAIQNGEIYNYLELREELQQRGHNFRTRSDTEVLPHAYQEWGDDFVSRLRGMFAVAVWDNHNKRLVLARDRFGKKPLHFVSNEAQLVFASEIQALLANHSVERTIDNDAIVDYLRLGYIPAPRTAFLHVRKLEPGHVLTYESGTWSTRPYWKLQFGPKLNLAIDDAAEELRARIEDAVKIRLTSDVPIGAFLSGGLDSSTVVAYMAKNSTTPVNTFAVGFNSREHDELRYARLVAQTFGTNHHELVVDASQTDILPSLVRHLGEPFADSSIVPTYYVARATRGHVTVVLTGDGGDELFAGYDRYRAAMLTAMTIGKAPTIARTLVARFATAIPRNTKLPSALLRTRRLLVATPRSDEDRYLEWSGYFTGDLLKLIVGHRLHAYAQSRAPAVLSRVEIDNAAVETADTYMAADMRMGLPGDLLVKMDIATMANSLEARSPLLDHQLAEFVARLPSSYKLSATHSKVLLRRAMIGVLPKETLGRRKMGFTAPVGAWLRGPLKPFFQDVVLSPRARDRGYVEPEVANQLFTEHRRGRADHTRLLWCLLMLELWFRECVDRDD